MTKHKKIIITSVIFQFLSLFIFLTLVETDNDYYLVTLYSVIGYLFLAIAYASYEREKEIIVKKEGYSLSLENKQKIYANMDHELKTPVIALKQVANKIDSFLMTLKKETAVSPSLYQFYFGCTETNVNICKTCEFKNNCKHSDNDIIWSDVMEKEISVLRNSILSINDTIALIKDQKNIQTPLIGDCDLYKLSNRSASVFEQLRKYKFAIRVDRRLEQFQCNPGENSKLGNVLGNLINNALDAQSTIIDISLINEKGNDGLTWVSVQDNGNIVPEDIQKNIWKLGVTSKKDGEGGFGLYLCKQLVEEIGGKIELLNSIKGSTIFLLKLKLNKRIDNE